ncbi:MAG: glycerophosphodiester phosphodiesterase family protein [Caldilinea sp.]
MRLLLWGSLLWLATCAPPATLPLPFSTPDPPQTLLPSPNFDVQGHRGARGLQPENTLPAFEVALDLGAPTLELDLHLTADGQVVIWHDEAISADKCYLVTADGPAPPDPSDRSVARESLYIARQTVAEVQQYRCDRNPDPGRFPLQAATPTLLAGDDYRIVRLADLFSFVDRYANAHEKSDRQRANAAQVHFNIETKRKPGNPAAIGDGFDGNHPGRFEQEIARLVEEAALTDRVILQSFDHRSLWAMRTILPELRLAALTSGATALPDLVSRGADIWSPDFTTLSQALLDEAHELGLTVIPWTVNEPADMQRLIEMGVDGLITDRPDLLLDNPQ